MSAARSIFGIWDYGYRAAGAGIRKGIALVVGADNTKAVKASAARAGKFRGVAMDEGAMPDGSANYGQDAEHPAEPVNAQKAGIAAGLVPATQVIVQGDQVVCDANAMFVPRTPYSVSAFIWGQFDESKTIGARAAFAGIELFPHYVEVVRPVTVSQPLKTTVLGAATVYGSGLGLAFSAAPVQLYRARFAGEVVRNLSLSLGIAPGGADTVAAAIMTSTDNGNNWTARAVTCTVSAAAFSATDLVNTYTLAAGEIVGIRFISSAGTAAGACASFDVT